MPVIISRNGSISVSGNSKFVSGDLVGGKVTVNGNVIEMGGGVIIGTELPKIDKTLNGIQSVDLDDCGEVSLQMGDVFKAVGEGVLRNSGDSATLSQFTGDDPAQPRRTNRNAQLWPRQRQGQDDQRQRQGELWFSPTDC